MGTHEAAFVMFVSAKRVCWTTQASPALLAVLVSHNAFRLLGSLVKHIRKWSEGSGNYMSSVRGTISNLIATFDCARLSSLLLMHRVQRFAHNMVFGPFDRWTPDDVLRKWNRPYC